MPAYVGLVFLQHVLQLCVLFRDASIRAVAVPAQLNHELDYVLHDGDQSGRDLLDRLLLAEGFEGHVALFRQVPQLVEQLLQPDIVLQRLAHLLYSHFSCKYSTKPLGHCVQDGLAIHGR